MSVGIDEVTTARSAEHPNHHALPRQRSGFGEIGADPQPPFVNCQRLERIEQHRLSHAAEAGQDQIIENRGLLKQFLEFFFFDLAAGQNTGAYAPPQGERDL